MMSDLPPEAEQAWRDYNAAAQIGDDAHAPFMSGWLAGRATPTDYAEALTPSGATKAAYMGEFSFNIEHEGYDGDGDPLEGSKRIPVPWTTIKEIMAAIRDRAATPNVSGLSHTGGDHG